MTVDAKLDNRPEDGHTSGAMARPRATQIVCRLWKTAPLKGGVCAFYYRVYSPGPDGRRVRVATVPRAVAWRARDVNVARRWIAEEEARLNAAGDPRRPVSLEEAIAEYVAFRRPRWRASTLTINRGILAAIRDAIGPTTILADVGARALIDYLNGRLARGEFGPRTYNKHLRHLRAFFEKCVRPLGWLAKNPCDGIDEIESDDERAKPSLSDDQAARVVLEALDRDPVLGLAAWTLVETGCRVGEMFSRHWPDIDFADSGGGVIEGALVVLGRAATKGHRARVLPQLSPELTERLWQYRAELQAAGRFSGWALRPWHRRGAETWCQWSAPHEARRLNRLVAACGKALGLSAPVASHAFRRTFSTAGTELGISEADMLASGGWSGPEVRRVHYTAAQALDDEAVRAAVRIGERRRFGERITAARKGLGNP